MHQPNHLTNHLTMNPSLELIDIGVNLMHRRFHADREAVILRAQAAGVKTQIITGTSLESSIAAAAYAAERPELYATAGVHPHGAQEVSDLAQLRLRLRELVTQPKVVAIGETGLDFNRDFSPREIQEDVFNAQLELACELHLPLFLHERDAHQRLLEILDRFGKQLPPAVVHCFTGTRAELEAYLERDYYIGITGWICDERHGSHLAELVQFIPADRLMIETDAPFLTPRDLRPKPRGGRNEPAFLPHVLKKVAASLNQSVEQVAAASITTTKRFFRL